MPTPASVLPISIIQQEASQNSPKANNKVKLPKLTLQNSLETLESNIITIHRLYSAALLKDPAALDNKDDINIK